jgi:DNA-binding CsgD family transcriptional regulator
MAAGDLSRQLLDLHRLAGETPLDSCREAMLASLRARISYDSAVWASGAEQPKLIFGINVVDFPLERLLAYADWQDQDVLRNEASLQPGVALRNEDIASLAAHYESAIYRNYCGPSGIEHALAIADVDPVTRVGELVFLFRGDRSRPFSDAECVFLQECMPHLLTAWRQRMYWTFAGHDVRRQANGSGLPTGYAIVDLEGHVHASDPPFAHALRAAFPGWMGPRLPERLRTALLDADPIIVVERQSFEILRGEARHVLRLRAPARSPLSTAETRVAELFAEGLTAREVAMRLHISPLTVRNHLTAIYVKLGVHSKAALVRWIERHSL